MKKSILLPFDVYQKLIKTSKEDDVPLKYDEEKVMSAIPKQMKSRAQAILNMISGTNITWNDKGELIVDNTTVPGSNICDLLKSVIVKYKFKPVGLDVFVKALADNNVPQTLIQNTECRSCESSKWVSFDV